MNDKRDIYINYEKAFEHYKWFEQIPFLKFKSEWDIKIIPPHSGAIIRFLVNNGVKQVSVYLDGYNHLGVENQPYWEIYPNESGDTERYYINEIESLLACIERSLRS